MAKLPISASKYTIYARLEADGTVEKPDVIGAIFGQTEGLLGKNMDLRELQQTGRIGRIEVELKNTHGKTSGTIIIPSSLDASETALIAACIETIERIGPCNAKVYIDRIEDVRAGKRKYIVERAKELLSRIFEEGVPEIEEISEQIKEAVRASEVVEYKGLPAGPNIESYDSIIVVEGRADVIKLLKNGIRNVIAIQGTSVPQAVIDLTRRKETTVFLDGDRGGDLILKELFATCDIDFVARAPRGKEVEDLTRKEIYKALREKVPADQARHELFKENGNHNHNHNHHQHQEQKQQQIKKKPRKIMIDKEKSSLFKKVLEELVGTRAAYFMKDNGEIIGKVPVKELPNTIRQVSADVIAVDGEIDQRLVNQCKQAGVKVLLGMKKKRINIPESMNVFVISDLQ